MGFHTSSLGGWGCLPCCLLQSGWGKLLRLSLATSKRSVLIAQFLCVAETFKMAPAVSRACRNGQGKPQKLPLPISNCSTLVILNVPAPSRRSLLISRDFTEVTRIMESEIHFANGRRWSQPCCSQICKFMISKFTYTKY